MASMTVVLCLVPCTHVFTFIFVKSLVSGDKELVDFLTEEINIEKKTEKAPAGSVKGFQIVSSKGADVELQKKI